MRLLLIQPLDYFMEFGGAHKANRLLMEGLTARGAECVVLCAQQEGLQTSMARGAARVVALLDHLGLAYTAEDGRYVTSRKGVTVHLAIDGLSYARGIAPLIAQHAPDVVIVTEDPSFASLEIALALAPGRVVYLSHSQATLPFGPDSMVPRSDCAALLPNAAGVIAVSDFLRRYIGTWAHAEAKVLRFPSYGPGPFPHFHNFDHGAVVMVNPSAIKGISIFEALTRRLPGERFVAVPTWATSTEERAQLRDLPNVELWEPRPVRALFAETRALVVPSLWGESFGQIVVDAMLHGVPVLAADVGGLPEAKAGVEYLVPVSQITRYKMPTTGEQIPRPIVPPQDVEPWVAALTELLGDRSRYEDVSLRSHEAAARFVSTIGFDSFEHYFASIAELAPRRGQARSTDVGAASLSADKRALLLKRLKRTKPVP